MLAVTGGGDNLTVQVVLRLYDSPAEVLLGFDVDCACVGFDGKEIWALPRSVRALKHGMNILNPLHAWPNRATYEYRLTKYASRGFGVAVPGLEETRIDWRAVNGASLGDLKGLARLAKMGGGLVGDLREQAIVGKPPGLCLDLSSLRGTERTLEQIQNAAGVARKARFL